MRRSSGPLLPSSDDRGGAGSVYRPRAESGRRGRRGEAAQVRLVPLSLVASLEWAAVADQALSDAAEPRPGAGCAQELEAFSLRLLRGVGLRDALLGAGRAGRLWSRPLFGILCSCLSSCRRTTRRRRWVSARRRWVGTRRWVSALVNRGSRGLGFGALRRVSARMAVDPRQEGSRVGHCDTQAWAPPAAVAKP
eukprot:scaffold1031_cov66-Phaeocystis_antarctica.AAC.3